MREFICSKVCLQCKFTAEQEQPISPHRVHAAAAWPHHSMVWQDTFSCARAWCLNQSTAHVRASRL